MVVPAGGYVVFSNDDAYNEARATQQRITDGLLDYTRSGEN